MHFVYDNLVASIIGSMVILLLVTVSIQRSEANIDAVGHYTNRVQTETFIDFLKHDMRNLGAGVDPSDAFITAFNWPDSGAASITLVGMVDTTAGATVDEIRYERVPASNSACTALNLTCYQVHRYVNESGTFVLSGSSPATVTEFTLALRTSAGTAAASYDDTRQVFASVTTAPSYVSPSTETPALLRWQTTFRPASLLGRDAN